MAYKKSAEERRRQRVRRQLKAAANGRARLSVYRSSANIYAQVIDDQNGNTVAAASTLDANVKGSVKNGGNIDAATAVGKLIAERAKEAGIEEVIFDRGSYIYHGRVKALAEAAREGGLKF